MFIAWLALLVIASVLGLALVAAVEASGRRNLLHRALPIGLAAVLVFGSFGGCGSDASNSTSDNNLELDDGEGDSDDSGSGSGAPRNGDEDGDEPAADSNGTSSPAPAPNGG